MNQTAVEWLVQELNLYAYLSQINKAKELEKQQIIDAYTDGRISYRDRQIVSMEQYYTETFKQQ